MTTTVEEAPVLPAPPTRPEAIEAWEQRLGAVFARTFREASRLTVSEWAECHRVLSKETSAEPGPWRNGRVPYLVEIMDSLSDPEVTEVVVVKSRRVGFTDGVIGNGVGFFVHQDPSPILILQPTEGDAGDWSKKQLAPLLRDTSVLAEVMPEAKSRDSKSTILDKAFPGGLIAVRGAHSPRNLRRLTARVVFFDELSAMLPTAEGDAVKLGEGRADTFPNRKLVKGSTPGVAGRCRITRDFERSDQRRYFVPCPHCEHEQVLEWGGPDESHGIKWEQEPAPEGYEAQPGEILRGEMIHRPATAHYVCESCAAVIEERAKPDMVSRGRWIATNPGAPVRGYHLNALVSLISDKARWSSLVEMWLEAQDDPSALQVFVNQMLGETWEEFDDKAQVDPESLEARAQLYVDARGHRIEVPKGVGLLTGFADVQHDRIEVLILGWGAREESWMIAHHRLHADTSQPEVYAQCDAIRTRAYRHESGRELRVMAFGIDSGDGARTGEIYAYVNAHRHEGVWATKGRDYRQSEPVKKSRTREGMPLLNIGTHTLKARLFARLTARADAEGSPPFGWLHFRGRDPEWHNGADAEFYAQFGREKPRRKRLTNGVWVTEWIKTGPNEAIDLYVGNFAMLDLLGPTWKAELGRLAEEAAAPLVAAPREEEARADAGAVAGPDWATGGGRWGIRW